MINFDMIGRLRDSTLKIMGTGTAEEWDKMLRKSNKLNLQLETIVSGKKGSDQMSFYLDSIPVLFYFTRTHDDNHKPSDDPEKIKYKGMLNVLKTVESLHANLPEDEKLTFQKTNSKHSGQKPANFNVTLGVMPNHTFDGNGMRIESVIKGRNASEAGLKEGDIVIKMGEHEVEDLRSYMKALSEFDKGSKTTLKVKRENKILEKKIQFK